MHCFGGILPLHLAVTYRRTSEILWVSSQTTEIKQVVIFLLAEGLAFNLYKKMQHLWGAIKWSAIKWGMLVFSYEWKQLYKAWLLLSVLSRLETEGRNIICSAHCIWCTQTQAHLSRCLNYTLPYSKQMIFQTNHEYHLLCRAILILSSKISCPVIFIC